MSIKNGTREREDFVIRPGTNYEVESIIAYAEKHGWEYDHDFVPLEDYYNGKSSCKELLFIISGDGFNNKKRTGSHKEPK